MAAELLTDASRALDANANPLAGATWTFYATGTSTLQTVYTTAALNVAHSNPVVADAGGKFPPIYFDASLIYRGVLRDEGGTTIQDIDPINTNVMADLVTSFANPEGAAQIGFSQPGAEDDARTSRDKMAERISLEDFGAVVGDAVATRAAFLKAKARIEDAGGELVVPGKEWSIGTDSLSMDGITIIAEDGAEIVGNWNRKAAYKLRGTMTTRLADASYDYLPYKESHLYQRPIAEKEVFLDGISADYTAHAAIDCTGITVYQVDWPAGDTWTTPVEAQTPTARTFPLTLTAAVWRTGLIFAQGGDELSVITSTGSFDRVAIIRTTGGYYYFFADGQTGAGHLWYKATGVAAVKISDFDWGGRTDHQFWQPGRATWAIRLYDLKTFSILLNGMEVVPATSTGSHIITYYGFGGKDSSGTIGTFSDWTLTRGKEAAGRGYRGIAFFGDSRTAPYHGSWPEYCAEVLEHSQGMSLLTKYNGAVDGWTTATTLTTIQDAQTAGILDSVNVAVVGVGTNDAQTAVSVATVISNLTSIIDLFQARSTPVIIVLPQDFYPKALTDNTGVVVFNEALTPAYRQAIHRLAASKGCRVVDLSQVLKPVLAYEANPPSSAWEGTYDSGLRDNIHNSELQYRKIGWAVARAIMSLWPEKKVSFDLSAIPTNLFDNGWSAASAAPLWAIDAQAKVTLSGQLTAGTKTDGTVIMRVPLNIAPRNDRLLPIIGVNGTRGRVLITALTGDVKIYEMSAAADASIYLDSLSWMAR